MDSISLQSVVDVALEAATHSSSGHSASTVYGGHEHRLRQTVIALSKGHELAEHESPGDATLFVLDGRVRLEAGGRSLEAETGDLVTIPAERHRVEALETSALLLTVALAG